HRAVVAVTAAGVALVMPSLHAPRWNSARALAEWSLTASAVSSNALMFNCSTPNADCLKAGVQAAAGSGSLTTVGNAGDPMLVRHRDCYDRTRARLALAACK